MTVYELSPRPKPGFGYAGVYSGWLHRTPVGFPKYLHALDRVLSRTHGPNPLLAAWPAEAPLFPGDWSIPVYMNRAGMSEGFHACVVAGVPIVWSWRPLVIRDHPMRFPAVRRKA